MHDPPRPGRRGLAAGARAAQAGEAEWADFVPSLAALARECFPHLPPQALPASLRVWGRMYGPVAPEVYRQFGPDANPRVLFQAEMDSALEMLGLDKPAPTA
ncbi:hypothetical protein [Streptomyces yangpuensis]|uniref:hypothetical protein n=1 Tax=Streptomyces yangpuensis TaxID=1648182 RepID=UPI00380428C6